MSAYFREIGLCGFAHWTKTQAKEEVGHAMTMFDYIIERGGKIVLKEIYISETKFESPLNVFEIIYEHEKLVSKSIDNIANLCDEENDKAARIFIDKFIEEQVEEESNACEVMSRLKLFGDDCTSLYLLDKELLQRAE